MAIQNIQVFGSADAVPVGTGGSAGIGVVGSSLIIKPDASTTLTLALTRLEELGELDAIPTTDQDDSVTVYSDSGVLKVSTAP